MCGWGESVRKGQEGMREGGNELSVMKMGGDGEGREEMREGGEGWGGMRKMERRWAEGK